MEPLASVVIDLHYLPSIEYFTCLLNYEIVYLEACEHFQKQSYRNRCKILTANKIATLSVPVFRASSKQFIREVQIDYSQKWLTDHWRTITSAYGKSAYFVHYAGVFEEIFLKKYKFLFDLNLDLLTACLSLLKINKRIEFTSGYNNYTEKGQDDFRSKIHLKPGERQSFIYRPVPYMQNFGSNFVSNLSIIDVLFCEGPYASNIIRQSLIQ
jgi:hypothetical protein